MAEETISVSRETLRAELSGLELRLVDRLTSALDHKADQAVLDQALARIGALELSRAERMHMPEEVSTIGNRVRSLERYRWQIPSAGALMGIAGICLAILQFFH